MNQSSPTPSFEDGYVEPGFGVNLIALSHDVTLVSITRTESTLDGDLNALTQETQNIFDSQFDDARTTLIGLHIAHFVLLVLLEVGMLRAVFQRLEREAQL